MLDLGMFVFVIPHDWRVISSGVAAGFGTAATIIRTVSSFVQSHSLEKKLKNEQARAVEVIDLLKKLQEVGGEQCSATRLQLETSLQLTLKKISELTKEASESQRRDSNYDLNLLQRMFLFFRPMGLREHLIHAFAYLFMFVGPLLLALVVWLWHKHSIKDNDTVADLIVLVCYGALVFRGWALAERRWRNGYEPTPRLFRKLLLMTKPVNQRMRVAQIFMWTCLFWLMESLEDLVFHTVEGQFATENLLSFSLALIGSVLCRTWAAEEWEHGHSGHSFRIWELLYSRVVPRHLRMVYVSITVLPLLVLFRLFGGDIFDVTGASIIWLFSCAAFSQWLYLTRSARQAPFVKAGKEMLRSAARNAETASHTELSHGVTEVQS